MKMFHDRMSFIIVIGMKRMTYSSFIELEILVESSIVQFISMVPCKVFWINSITLKSNNFSANRSWIFRDCSVNNVRFQSYRDNGCVIITISDKQIDRNLHKYLDWVRRNLSLVHSVSVMISVINVSTSVPWVG